MLRAPCRPAANGYRERKSCVMKSTASEDHPSSGRCRCLAAPLVRAGELDANLSSVDPDEFAAPERETRRGQQQEELTRSQHVGRPLDFQLRAALRYVEKDATSAPGTIDAHEIDRMSVIEPDTSGPSAFAFHRGPPA